METNRTSVAAAFAAIILLGVAAGCGGAGAQATSSSSTLVGAGSTLVAPLLAQWEPAYSTAEGVTITYGAIGSGGGITQISARTVDFGASDAPLSSGQEKACSGCVEVPWALAATTLSYNVPGLSKPLRLNGVTIAGIYLGQITTWNAGAIAKLNPGVHLPALSIKPVYRSDASGDTYAFTDYLSKVSPAWRSKVGVSTSVAWPTGAGAAKNSGVAAVVQETPGAVGYVAIGQAVGSNLHYAYVQNGAGKFEKPSTKTIAAAAATARFKKDNSASIVDPPASAKTAYPISTFTYVIVPRSSEELAGLKQFLLYAVTTGQQHAAALDFAPLPKNVVAKDKAAINGL